MQIKRAIGASVLTYIASFILGSIFAISAGINLAETQAIPPSMWYLAAVSAIVFAAGFAYWYFRSPKTHPCAKEGLLLGITMIITGFVLDMITFLPLLTHPDPFGPILDYYSSPFFWSTLALILGVTSLTGWWLGKKASASTKS